MADQRFRRWRITFEVTTYWGWHRSNVWNWISKILTDRELITLKIEEINEMTEHHSRRRTPALQDWVMDLTIMQQSVLMSALRGPDTLPKNHVAKLLLRWYRRCILISAFDKMTIRNPYFSGGGSFTGPSILPGSSAGALIMNPIGPEDTIHGWQEEMDILVKQYLSSCDEVPHHFHLHLMHGAEVLGFKHPDAIVRNWWYRTYASMTNDMHLRPELLAQFEKRLGDREVDWRAAEEVTAKGPEPDQDLTGTGRTGSASNARAIGDEEVGR